MRRTLAALAAVMSLSSASEAGIVAGMCSKDTELLGGLFAQWGEEPFIDAYVGTPGSPTGAKGVITWNEKTGSWSLLVEGDMPGTLCIGTGGHLMGPTKRKTINPAERPS